MSAAADDLHSVTEASVKRAGPIVWAAIVGFTCVFLFLLQKMLWLVVPALFALVLYYFLQPCMQYLIHAGIRRDNAASLVMVGFLAGSGVIVVVLMPWITSHVEGWQESVMSYAQGGLGLLERSLRGLEQTFPRLAKARFADMVMARLDHSSGGVFDHVETIAIGVVSWAPSLVLAPFLSFFFLRDGLSFERFIASAVPNAFFERSLCLLHQVDQTLRAYFKGLIKLTILDTITLAAGLALLGFPGAFALGLICAVLAWIPFVGSVLGGLLVVLVAATDFPGDTAMAYWAVALFVFVRVLDDFVYMPLTIGKSLHMHPMLTVLMIFVGGAVAGVAGLVLVLPLLGVVMVIGETIGHVVTDDRLRGRYRHERMLRRVAASGDLLP